MSGEGIWQCNGCGTIFPEYINGCTRDHGQPRKVRMVVPPPESVECPRCEGCGAKDFETADGDLLVAVEDCDLCEGSGRTSPERADSWSRFDRGESEASDEMDES